MASQRRTFGDEVVLSEMSSGGDVVAINEYVVTIPRLLLLSLTAFLISYLQIFGESPDYRSYDFFFDSLRWSGLDIFRETRFEPGFTILGLALVTLVSSNLVVYGLIVAAAMFLKGFVVARFSSNQAVFCAVVAFYFVRYFPLHELTQLRAGMAAAMLLVAAAFMWNGKKAFGLFAGTIGLMFHLSAVFVSPFLFLKPAKRWEAVLIGLVVFLALSVGVNLLISALGDSVPLLDMYQQAGFGDAPNRISAALLLDWMMIILSLSMWSRLSLPMRQVLLLEIVGMAIFYGTIDFSVIAHRLRELFSVFWVIFVAHGLRSGFIAKLTSGGFVLANIGLYSYLHFFGRQFFT